MLWSCSLPIAQAYASPSRLHWSLVTLSPLKLFTSSDSELIDKIKSFEMMEEKDLGMTTRPVSSSTEVDLEEDAYITPLQKDIDLLLNILGEVIQREDVKVYELFEKFRSEAVTRSHGNTDALGRMITACQRISPSETLGITRAFTQTLNLINAAEVHNRIRRLRASDIESNRLTPLPMKEDSVAGTIDNILEQTPSEDMKERIFQNLLKQKVDFVLTAHPTEVNRRTLLRKYRSITECLATLDRQDLTPYERNQALYTLKREIASIWGSDEIRRQKPTPQQEARGGLAILESVLWDAVPSYLRKLNQQCIHSLGFRLLAASILLT